MAGEKPSTPPKKLKVLLGLENRKSVRNADSPRSTWLTISYDHERALVLIPRKKGLPKRGSAHNYPAAAPS